MSYSEDFLPDPTFTETKSLVFSQQQSDKIQSQGSESSTAGMQSLHSSLH